MEYIKIDSSNATEPQTLIFPIFIQHLTPIFSFVFIVEACDFFKIIFKRPFYPSFIPDFILLDRPNDNIFYSK